MKLNDRSSKIVISAGTIWPRWFSVAALYALQKSMMLIPCGPSAVPTGGAGVACPAWIWIFTVAATRFFATVFAPLPLSYFRFARSAASSLASLGRRVVRTGRLLLQLCYLAEFELDRGLAAEDVDQHLELGAVDVNLVDGAVEVRERPGD